ncbi:hypothetical protein QJQ45_007662 [Haematococcus lacustris]|nr:hypothetical protein QJQ45_007662 [Haematococcus lacustris]
MEPEDAAFQAQRLHPCLDGSITITHPISPAGNTNLNEAKQPAASEPGTSIPLPAKRSKRTKAEQAAESTHPSKGTGKAKGKAAKAKPAPQPGRWLDNAALIMQRIGESRWQPLELCWCPDLLELPTKGKEYPALG